VAPGVSTNAGAGSFAEPRVGKPDHRGPFDLGEHHEQFLDLAGRDVHPAPDDDLPSCGPTTVTNPFAVECHQVAGADPAVGAERAAVRSESRKNPTQVFGPRTNSSPGSPGGTGVPSSACTASSTWLSAGPSVFACRSGGESGRFHVATSTSVEP